MIEKIGLDYGRKQPKLERGFINAINSGPYPVIIGHDNILSQSDPQHDVVFAFSLTTNFQEIADKGFRMYPTFEQIIAAADKLNLYDYCRRENIITPLTFPIPNTFLSLLKDDKNVRKLQTLYHALRNGIIKPRLAVGQARENTDHVYDPIAAKWNTILTHARESGIDFVMQEKIQGPIRKVYGYPGYFYYETLGNDHRDAKPVPPSIARMCQTVLTDFGLHWGGLDFIEDSDGIWHLFDINTTAVGRSIPSDKTTEFNSRMQPLIEGVMRGEKPVPLDQKLKIVITAAGQNKRLKLLLRDKPKTLVELPDKSVVLDHVMKLTRSFQNKAHTSESIDILCRQDQLPSFEDWRRKTTTSLHSNLVTVNDQLIPSNHSSINDVFSALPDNQYVLMLSGDKIVEYPKEVLEQCSKDVYHALTDEKAPFVIIGIPSKNKSVYQYKVDSNGRILECKRGEISNGINVRKVGFAFNTGKLPITDSSNTQNIAVELSKRGVLGKLIMLPKPSWVGDLDTEDDISFFQNHFSG